MSTKSPLKARRNNSRSRIEKILQIFRHPSSEKEKMIRIALEFDHGINFSKRYPRAAVLYLPGPSSLSGYSSISL